MKLGTYLNISVPNRLLCDITIISVVLFPLFMMDSSNSINSCVKES